MTHAAYHSTVCTSASANATSWLRLLTITFRCVWLPSPHHPTPPPLTHTTTTAAACHLPYVRLHTLVHTRLETKDLWLQEQVRLQEAQLRESTLQSKMAELTERQKDLHRQLDEVQMLGTLQQHQGMQNCSNFARPCPARSLIHGVAVHAAPAYMRLLDRS